MSAEVCAEKIESIVRLTSDLVRTPSRGGVDDYRPIVEIVEGWLIDHGLSATRLDQGGELLGLVCELEGGRSGPRWVLDACLDTAPFGDLASWRHEPTSAVVEEGWLYGRGSADSKVAVAIFCHVAAALGSEAGRGVDRLSLVFDADEHTGRFGGARAYFGGTLPGTVGGVMIGYPGNDRLVAGSRGFLRVRVDVRGTAGHSGSAGKRGINAVERAAHLVGLLHESPLRDVPVAGFELPPRLTVTGIRGGDGFSVVPDLCSVDVDIRLTPAFDATAARQLLDSAVADLDRSRPGPAPTTIHFDETWPAYRLVPGSPLVTALRDAAEQACGRNIPAGVCGPSNIGNYLASRGIEATAGYGVRYRNAHGADECIDLATIPEVYTTYLGAVRRLLAGPVLDSPSPAD